MKKSIHISDTLQIPAEEFAIQGNAFLGIRESGKSYSATYIAEQLDEAGIPFVAFDPIGVWKYLKAKGPGPNGKGFPIVVAAATGGDLPLTVANAPEIMRAAMRENVSIVFDLFNVKITKKDFRAIVAACVEVLLHENPAYGLRHLFFEEAAEVAPQMVRPEVAHVYCLMESLARMGGNSSLGFSLINQRPEQVNKSLLELCDGAFLFRQKGKNSLTGMGKWLDFTSPEKSKKIIETIPTLGAGECWLWPRESSDPILVKMPQKRSFHPDRRNPAAAAKASRVNVSTFVSRMTMALPQIETERKENDPEELKKEIRKLKVELSRTVAMTTPPAAPERIEVPILNRDDALKLVELNDNVKLIIEAQQRLAAAVEAKTFKGTVITFVKPPKSTVRQPIVMLSGERLATGIKGPQQKLYTLQPGDDEKALTTGCKAVLLACAQYAEGATKEQIAILTGYKKTSYNTYLQKLGQLGYVMPTGQGTMEATAAGITALGSDFQPLPTGAKLREYWLYRLPQGEKRVLEVLLEAYPNPVSRDQIDEATGYKKTSRNTYLQKLNVRKLIEIHGDGVKASSQLF
jgi:hypothetical protein